MYFTYDINSFDIIIFHGLSVARDDERPLTHRPMPEKYYSKTHATAVRQKVRVRLERHRGK